MKKRLKIKNKGLKIKGFTLVELLVSSAIFMTVATIIVTILFISFRVTQRTENTLLLKNSGSNALTQMVNIIKYARSIENPLDCTTPVEQSFITVTSSFDGGQTSFSCPTEDMPTISSNSSSLINSSAIQVTNCKFICSQVTEYDPPTITIQFELLPLNVVDSNDNLAVYPFQTSVTLRNFTR